ncbi:hypothetical protein AC1031_019487 [Aphanomyces cochlioides]|nr:hypothetical protein AC1031_019487 [Aphanomyces cochlioides]
MATSSVYDPTTTDLATEASLPQDFDRMHLLDMLCMCREFKTPESHLSDQLNSTECASIGFDERWSVFTNTSEAKKVWLDGSEIVLGGVHALAFVSRDPEPKLVIAFRHQEGDSLGDDDMWEAMGIWGRDFSKMQDPPAISDGGFMDYITRASQWVIFGWRSAFGLNYFPKAVTLVEELTAAHTFSSVTFTGYSMGGALAQLLAIQTSSNATVFASNGIVDVLDLYSMPPTSNATLVNILDPRDSVPKMDCQMGTLLLPPTEASAEYEDPGNVHARFVYGDLAWKQIHSTYEVIHGRPWSFENSYCIGNILDTPRSYVVDSVFQVASTQSLLTLAIGFIVFMVIRRLTT